MLQNIASSGAHSKAVQALVARGSLMPNLSNRGIRSQPLEPTRLLSSRRCSHQNERIRFDRVFGSGNSHANIAFVAASSHEAGMLTILVTPPEKVVVASSALLNRTHAITRSPFEAHPERRSVSTRCDCG
eukprot:TRINITY_DN1806_c0_g1_i17.p2 TRINITY_DN1806_c0_g1~~TRINITY_DN1806_c0_g1_i17.p2  ORF type:complete len:130 (-),score=7.29 TRINITY_DN1806_c0_g1_i17:246-635(-)